MPETTVIGRSTQLGLETVHGTAPAAGATKILSDLMISLDPNFGVNEIRGTGRRFFSVVSPNGQEYTGGKLSGALGYNSWVYPLSMAFGDPDATYPKLATGGVNAYEWCWTVPLTGAIDPRSYDIEQGDAQDAERALFGILQTIGVDATRTGVSPAGDLIARAIEKAEAGTDFEAMTDTGLTTLALMPVLPDEWSVYMETSSAGLPATIGPATNKLTRAFHAKIDYGGAYVPFFPLDCAQDSFAGIADTGEIKATFLVELMKDPLAGESLWKPARAGTRRWFRFIAGGVGCSPLVDNYTTLHFTGGSMTGGHMHLTYKGVTSGEITVTGSQITAAAINAAIAAMSTVGADAVATGGPLPGTDIKITMSGELANDTSAWTADVSGLTPTPPTASWTATTIAYQMQYDLCAAVTNPGGQKDFEGLRTREWTFDIVEDPNWSGGRALQIKLVNAIASL